MTQSNQPGSNLVDGSKTSATPDLEERSVESIARQLTSESLFQGQREVLISHEGQIYRLRVTRGGKLILNK